MWGLYMATVEVQWDTCAMSKTYLFRGIWNVCIPVLLATFVIAVSSYEVDKVA